MPLVRVGPGRDVRTQRAFPRTGHRRQTIHVPPFYTRQGPPERYHMTISQPDERTSIRATIVAHYDNRCVVKGWAR